MKFALTCLPVCLLVLAVFSAPVFGADSEEGRLTAYFKAYLEEAFRLRPLEATRLGDHRFDHLLDDISAKARDEWTVHYRQTLAELPKKVDYAKLPRSAQIDYEIFKHNLTAALWLAVNTRPFENDPRTYNDYLSDSVYLLLTQSTQPKATNIHNAAARMAHFPKIIAAARENLRNPPRVILETAIRQTRGAIAFYQHGIYEVAGENPQLSELKPAATRVVPLLKEHLKLLEGLLPKAKGDWRLGKEKFYRKLDLELDANLSADEVLKEAEDDFARVERDMYIIARQLWSGTYPGKPLPPDDAKGRTETIRLVLDKLNQEHGKPEDLVKNARATVKRIKSFITENDILRLPSPDQCKIIEMPEFHRGNSLAYLNPAPPLDSKAASYYAVSPPPSGWDARRVESLLQEYNNRMLQILTIHEAYPGHYVQLEYSNRHPSLIRRVLFSGVFAEGWAVYTEQMMLDQGYGRGDPALRLNQLKWYLRSVANAVLDHKMHCTNMSDEEAVAFLTQRAFQAEGEAVAKVVRAKQSSCQLSTYFVGRMAFYRLRQQIQREMGAKFQLGRYHEAVLDHGTLPVKYLPELVRERLKRPRSK
ncbi:MAG TPA: DUF885 domain-containing protein [Gemmataceae bacterium]|nr:DUF885 domain-containing protein [Gemmataceae bacterium]